MADSSDEEISNEWIPYARRAEWTDVVPLEQDDGENAVVVIAYSERCKYLFPILAIFNRFSGIFYSTLRHNNDNSFCCSFIVKDVYNYFRAILSSGEKSPRALQLTNDALKLNASNYTVWQYR